MSGSEGKVPVQVKALLVLVVLVLLLGAIIGAFLFNWKVGLALVVGLVLLIVLLVVIGAVMAKLGKSKGKPFEQELSSNAGAAPAGVSAAASRAKLDDMRRQFEEGIETFRRHGKDVYSLPWYMIVGEPGSGKTEVIRNSGIGFPPGLQDELQGSGGTINMDWWFSSNAVILDTAGKLLFEEVGATATSEWKEFLRLLGKYRKNCPINGLILVLPADSLIKDSPEEIEDKGARIAQQLDLIQRSLDVRFPVFVLITKADLMAGFREFFDELDDPQLAHQMLGWSNQADLDEPFAPEDVVEHMLEIKDRLIRRRGGLLLDPVAREGTSRIDEVDELHAFPKSVEEMIPRLKKYMELLFGRGEWSTQPLFLRGIYFASSMQEGAALDQALAGAMGVPVDALPEGNLLERNRSYFIRDLFLEKMFRERGLVTRASNTSQLMRKRKLAMFGFTAAAVTLFLVLTLWQAYVFRSNIGSARAFWADAAATYAEDENYGPSDEGYPVVVGGEEQRRTYGRLAYLGPQSAYSPGGRLTSGTFGGLPGGRVEVREIPGVLAEKAGEAIDVPLLFWPATWFSNTTDPALRQRAAQSILTHAYLQPLTWRASWGLIEDGPAERGTVEAQGAALLQLLRMRAASPADVPRLGPLFAYVLREGQQGTSGSSEVPAGDIDAMQRGFEGVYANAIDGWPASVLGAAAGEATKSFRQNDVETRVLAMVSQYSSAATGQFDVAGVGGQGELAQALRLVTGMRAFRDAEDRLQDVYLNPADPTQLDLTAWNAQIVAMRRAVQTIESNEDVFLRSAESSDFSAWLDRRLRSAIEGTKADIDAMLATLSEVGEAGESGSANALATAKSELLNARAAVEQQTSEFDLVALGELGNDLFASVEVDPESIPVRLAYRLRWNEMYQRVHGMLERETRITRFADFPRALAAFNQEAEAERERLGRIRNAIPRTPTKRFAADVCDAVLTLVAADVVEGYRADAANVQDVPTTLPRAREIVDDLADGRGSLASGWSSLDAIGLGATYESEPQYHSVYGPAVLSAMLEVERELRESNREARADASRAARVDYAIAYLEYWSELLSEGGGLDAREWSEVVEALEAIQPRQLVDDLEAVTRARKQALAWDAGLQSEDDWPAGVSDRRAAILASLQAQEDQLLDDRKGRAWLDRWGGLNSDVQQARDELLALEVAEFMEEFWMSSSVEAPQASEFWYGVALSAMQTMAEEIRQQAAQAGEELEDLMRFPLVRLPDGADLARLSPEASRAGRDRVLSPEQLQRADELVERMMPSRENRAYDRDQLGNPSGETEIRMVDDLLETLRGGDVLPAPWTEAKLENVRTLLTGFRLARNDSVPFTMRVLVEGDLPWPSGVGDLNVPHTTIRVEQERGGEWETVEDVLYTNTDAVLIDRGDRLGYPGDPLRLVFYSRGTNDPADEIEIQGSWAPLALIHQFDGELMEDEGGSQIWRVLATVERDGRTFGAWLEIQLSASLPELDAWWEGP